MSNFNAELPSLNEEYWNNRWLKQQTGWDIGNAVPAIVKYMKQYHNKAAAILIPGCGNAYEAEFLLSEGFNNITIIDIAKEATTRLKEKFNENKNIRVLNEDFFSQEGKYDLIIEHTFFCAISPLLRESYTRKTNKLLNKNGKIVGLLFDRDFNSQQPPFGGHKSEYDSLFSDYFIIKKMDRCYNSIPPRANSELFIHLIKK